MGLYKNKYNPISGQFNLVPTATIVTFKAGVANAAALPLSGNTLNDGRITSDTNNLYVWDGTTWINQGDLYDLTWAALQDKPLSSVSNIDDAVSKRHSNSLDHSNSRDHTQGTDQGLDTGGSNAVTAAQAKAGYSHSQVAHAPSDAVSLATVKADTDIDNAIDNSHAPHSDDQVIPDQLSDLSDDTTHRLVTDTEKSTWNGKQDSIGFSAQDIIDISLNVMLNAFRIAQIGSLTLFNMVKGFMDEYEDESGIDLVNSIGQTYDSTNDCYLNYAAIDSYTKLLLHLNNNVLDSELTPKTVTNNSVTFSSGTKKFGTHAGYFDGSAYLSVVDNGDFNFGSSNFTVDMWIYPTVTDTRLGLFSLRLNGYEGCIFVIDSNNKLFFIAEDNGVNPWIILTPSNATISPNVWTHIALVRNGDNFAYYINGVKDTVNINSSIAIYNSGQNLKIGFDGTDGFVGYIDEFRISNGIARWTSDFTPPISEYTGESSDITILSNAQVATIVPTDVRIILFEEDVDVTTINTDLKAYVSRDNGTTYSQATLEDEGNYITGARILSGNVNISTQPSGSNIKYKIETLNTKKLKIHGTAVSWK